MERFGLHVERDFEARRDRVYAAFTDTGLRSRWLRPADDWTVPVTELDPRVDGAYRDVFRSPDGRTFTESGRFEALDAPERLLYSCRFEGDGILEPDMRVEIRLEELGDGRTRLRLSQTGYESRQNRDEQERGWPAFLDQLARVLAEP